MPTPPNELKAKHALNEAKREELIGLLTKAYNAEIETVANYVANAVHLDGMLAKGVKDSLAADATEELGHAQQLARRIKLLGGPIPGSQTLKMSQASLQPPASTVDVKAVILGVIEAEDDAIDTYQAIIEAAGGSDPVTEDLAITLKADEEEHRREFVGFLREFEAMKAMFTE
ncbi:MAG: ferritin-like domain-containing protein [Planctomycetota bacterium]